MVCSVQVKQENREVFASPTNLDRAESGVDLSPDGGYKIRRKVNGE